MDARQVHKRAIGGELCFLTDASLFFFFSLSSADRVILI
jgi:hypothetical protein